MLGWPAVPDTQGALRPRRPGQLVLALQAYPLLELAVNVMQNGWNLEEAYDHVAHSDRPLMSLADCAGVDTQPSALSMQASRAMLEDIYREVLRRNLEAVSLGCREGT